MNNEIGRKITSLTLMTIMLASAFAAGAPSIIPQAAAANANLFVSAENSQFQNYFAGPMVIEVVVIDSDIKDTDKGKGEPDVTVNGKDLRMVQAVDGNWYAYFADRSQAQIADQTVVDAYTGSNVAAGNGLDFGTFCDNTSTVTGFSVSDTVGIAVPVNYGAFPGTQGVQGTTTITGNTCAVGSANTTSGNIVREAKEPNPAVGTTVKRGQIGLSSSATTSTDVWPFVQLYSFNPTGNVVVQYNKGGGVQVTTLKFDTVDQFAKASLDRAVYPLGAAVHATITDLQLNIDPTDEDSWTFQTTKTNHTTNYQVFNENGGRAGDASATGVVDITSKLGPLMFEDNGILLINGDTQNSGTSVITLGDNDDSAIIGNTAATAATVGSQSLHGRLTAGTQPVTITESGPNTGIFGTYDESDNSVIDIATNAPRGKSASIDYNETPATILVGFGFGSIDIKPTDAEWNSGEEIPVVLTDSDANKNSRADEDLDVFNPDSTLIPALRIGNPFTLGANGTEVKDSIRAHIISGYTLGVGPTSNSTFTYTGAQTGSTNSITVNKFSDRAILTPNSAVAGTEGVVVTYGKTADDLRKTVIDTRGTSATTATSGGNRLHGFNFFNYDIRGINQTIGSSSVDVYLAYTNATALITNTGATQLFRTINLANNTSAQGLINLNDTSATAGTSDDQIIREIYEIPATRQLGAVFTITPPVNNTAGSKMPIVADFFSFGYLKDGLVKADRVNNMIVRVEAEETGDNTSVFEGTLEYVMLNQLNILDVNTYADLTTIANDPQFIVHQDLDDEEAPRINYNDLGADGSITQIADQEDAPTHSGVVSFNQPTYKKADTVVVTLEDLDLNTDVDLIEIYTPVNASRDAADGTVGKAGLPVFTNQDPLGRLLDITFDDRQWKDSANSCTAALDAEGIDLGLVDATFTLIETGPATGVFTGNFIVPGKVCRPAVTNNLGVVVQAADTAPINAQGLDMEVNYVDFRDASGQIVEVGDGAGIRANTGSVSLDRTVYPVPFGSIDDFNTPTDNSAPSGRSIFPIHLTGIGTDGIQASETLGDGALTIHVQVNDPDFDTSASGEDKINENAGSKARGPVKVTVSRGQEKVVLAYAGGPVVRNGVIDVADNNGTLANIRDLGPISETSPSSGIFEFDLDLDYTDGPASSTCPTTVSFDSLTAPGAKAGRDSRFDQGSTVGSYCILQGDIITAEYTDPADASGDINTVTDSATFDLRNGALQSDKSVYIIGSDMILTLIEPDFDLDNDLAETYDLDLIEWDSDAATVTMGDKGNNAAAFDPEPSDLRETGDSTGIFQTVIEIPQTLNNDKLERGEEIVLEYTDWGPSGADFVGQEDEDINLTLFTSNFGATVELDQKVYTWTDKVYLTVVAPDHNFDSNLIDEIGTSNADPLKVATRGHALNKYKLVETGTDTGIFTGEVILTGFNHDANGDVQAGGVPPNQTTGSGPTNGFLQADDDDGLTVSYEFSEDETVVGSALVRWNIGEVAWIEASYPASGTGVVRVIDPDMNLNPEAVDNFNVDVWSDSDAGGIDLTVTETNEATGIFEGTVFFTTTDDSSGHRLRVAEGDTVTAEYRDETLPDPYTTADELDITGTAFIGTVVPPLERAPASNARVVDAFGNTLDEVAVDQQVQITADLTNGQDREQPFAYLVQVQDENGVTVALAWITGSLAPGQSFSPALSWIATAPGTYTATVFVWESVDNPTALSPPVSVDITVS